MLMLIFRYGESHCLSVGVIVDGCPPRLALTEDDIQPQLTRRRPGQSALTTPRDEKDRVEIQAGTERGLTLGSPIAMRVRNENQRPSDYKSKTMDLYPRPSHADYTYQLKYGIRASSGGGRASARETIGVFCQPEACLILTFKGRVAAGAIAEKCLRLICGVETVAFVSSVGNEFLFPPTAIHPTPATNPEFLKLLETIDRPTVDSFTPVRCPNAEAAKRMEALIRHFKDQNDSIGGTITCVIRNVPAGLGEPCFDKLEAKLAHAMLSLPATKGFEIGSGFGGCRIPGSIHNDPFIKSPAVPASQSGLNLNVPRPQLTTKTNNSGGIQGGISNGAHIYFTVAFKPPATIGQAQETATYDLEDGVLEAKGRHDPCVVPRAVSIVESMAALVLMDAFMAQQARLGTADIIVAAQEAEKRKAVGEVNGQ
jgi:chorismate synthase